MDKMRKEFDDWAISELGYNERLGDGYKDREVNSSWMAWKASRAALCVELPIQYQAPLVDEPAMDADEVRWALDESGVSYK